MKIEMRDLPACVVIASITNHSNELLETITIDPLRRAIEDVECVDLLAVMESLHVEIEARKLAGVFAEPIRMRVALVALSGGQLP